MKCEINFVFGIACRYGFDILLLLRLRAFARKTSAITYGGNMISFGEALLGIFRWENLRRLFICYVIIFIIWLPMVHFGVFGGGWGWGWDWEDNMGLTFIMANMTLWGIGWYAWWKWWTDQLERIGFFVGCVLSTLMYVWTIGGAFLFAGFLPIWVWGLLTGSY